jgi:nitroimidazol reductase NimA-like FMN-containing flavoprotein (pyridoxamine 5'-phosphate oxidase superfamily)
MTETFVYDVIRRHRLAVLATTSADQQPEAAVVGIAITPHLEIVFDTVRASRKYRNLVAQPRVAIVIGMKNEITTQYEGIAVELRGPEDDVYREAYYSVFPDGRERAATWEGLVHFVVKPRWIRYSNYKEPVQIEELRFS